jgi:hypothetical protein
MLGTYLHSPNTPSWGDAQLKQGDNFTFLLCLFPKILSVNFRYQKPSVFPEVTLSDGRTDAFASCAFCEEHTKI